MPDQAAARQTDATEHGGVIVLASEDVLLNDLGAARVTDYHTCPAETEAGVAHLGGPIEKGSKTVLVNDLPAARITDPLLCLTPPPPPEEPDLAGCEGYFVASTGYEKKQIGKLATNKAYLYGLDSKGTCRLARVVDESAEGALGKVRGTVDLVRGEIKGQLGASHDPVKNEGFAGGDFAIGGSLIDGRAKYATPQLPIPFTDFGVGLEAEVFGAIGALEAKAKVKATWEKRRVKLEAETKAGAGLGAGVKIGIVLGPRPSALLGDLPQDLISAGSPDVFIGD